MPAAPRPAVRAGGADKPATPPKPRNDADRRRGKLTVSNALNDDGERARSLAAFRRRQERQKKQAMRWFGNQGEGCPRSDHS